MPRPRRDGQPTREITRRKLTDAFVRTVKAETEAVLIWDSEIRRMCLSIQPTGAKSFKLNYSMGGRSRWVHLGEISIGLKEARKSAQTFLGRIAQGVDVAAEKKAARQAGTFEELYARYLQEHATKCLKSWKQKDFVVRRYILPKLGKVRVLDIRRGDIRGLFNRITQENGAGIGNQTLAHASAVFSWAIKQEAVASLTANPCHGISQNGIASRERVLSDAEVGRFWAGLDQAGLVRGSALKTILLTGQRPGEVSRMRWQDVEVGRHQFTDPNNRKFEVQGGWWTLKGAADGDWPGTKNGASHRVWLSKMVLDILNEVGEGTSGFVFQGPHGRPVEELDYAMGRLCRQLGIAKDNKLTPHDLRRSFATTAASLGVGRQQLDRLLNHVDGGVGSIYDRHSYAAEDMRAWEAVCSKLLSLVAGEPAEAKVIVLHA